MTNPPSYDPFEDDGDTRPAPRPPAPIPDPVNDPGDMFGSVPPPPAPVPPAAPSGSYGDDLFSSSPQPNGAAAPSAASDGFDPFDSTPSLASAPVPPPATSEPTFAGVVPSSDPALDTNHWDGIVNPAPGEGTPAVALAEEVAPKGKKRKTKAPKAPKEPKEPGESKPFALSGLVRDVLVLGVGVGVGLVGAMTIAGGDDEPVAKEPTVKTEKVVQSPKECVGLAMGLAQVDGAVQDLDAVIKDYSELIVPTFKAGQANNKARGAQILKQQKALNAKKAAALKAVEGADVGACVDAIEKNMPKSDAPAEDKGDGAASGEETAQSNDPALVATEKAIITAVEKKAASGETINSADVLADAGKALGVGIPDGVRVTMFATVNDTYSFTVASDAGERTYKSK